MNNKLKSIFKISRKRDVSKTINIDTNYKNDYDIIQEEEFFIPTLGLQLDPYLAINDLQGIHHLARYHWAVNVINSFKPGRMLDIACGAGYGSFILASSFPEWEIIGVDYDTRAIEYATNTYNLKNLNFKNGNLETWEEIINEGSLDLGEFDLVISFDTIEHLSHPEIALLRITENFSPNGVLILSTPISFPTTNLKPDWSAHKIEYGAHDLANLLKRFFHKVLIPEDESLPNMDFWKTIVNKDKDRYLNVSNPIVCKNPIQF